MRVPKKAMQGTPWYQILSNTKYSNQFGYIGAFVNEREKLIEDGLGGDLDNNGNLPREIVDTRCEQSDMVIVLLNLAYIPDTVVKQLGKYKFEPGWSHKFRKLMKKYKQEFEEFTAEWKY